MPAAHATCRERHSSQPTKAVNGTSAADSSTKGSWAARQAPRSGSKMAIEAAATTEVSGIQWPLLGTGSVGSAGSRPPTSRKLQSAGAVKPCPSTSCWATMK